MKHFLLPICAALLALPATAQRTFDPAADALRQFNAYKPTIERTEKAAVDEPRAITGDLNGDGRTDCILFFVLTPQGGGNAIVGRQAAVYLNTGKGMKPVGAFPELDDCYAVDRIDRTGLVYVDTYECAPPYNTKIGTKRYRWRGTKLVAATR